MQAVRTRGKDPKEGDDLYLELMRACSALDRDFLKAKHLAEMIATGKLTMEQSVVIVIHELERSTGRVALVEGRPRMSVEDHLRALEEELEKFSEEDDDLDREIQAKLEELRSRKADRVDDRKRLERAIAGLKKAMEPPARRSGGSGGGTHKKSPCPWPGCERELAPQGRRKHLEKHEETTGLTLEQAVAQDEAA